MSGGTGTARAKEKIARFVGRPLHEQIEQDIAAERAKARIEAIIGRSLTPEETEDVGGEIAARAAARQSRPQNRKG